MLSGRTPNVYPRLPLYAGKGRHLAWRMYWGIPVPDETETGKGRNEGYRASHPAKLPLFLVGERVGENKQGARKGESSPQYLTSTARYAGGTHAASR